MGVLTLLLSAVNLFGGVVIRSVLKKMEDNEARDAGIQRDFAAFREAVARDYVPRSEHREMRDEFRDGLRDIDQKLTEINNKLYRNQDKQ
ncbi:hypothetical protein KDX23_18370 [Burkholderia vietnamiensis]|nr:hypothetical protein [Burkholderia vietnamiensis]MBR8084704.1 hypothetical protein [Burkholderia vietnamiensis]